MRANAEPYYHGAWRRRPYAPRAYETLTSFAIPADSADEAGLLAWKMGTRGGDRAVAEFYADHAPTLGEAKWCGPRPCAAAPAAQRRAPPSSRRLPAAVV